MKTIVITAGGTIEPIDGVRGITNFSRGRLGCSIAERLAQNHKVFYIRSRTAPKAYNVVPGNPSFHNNLVEIVVSDTASVWKAIQDVHSQTKVDMFIHAMAISDYTVDKIVDLDKLIAQAVAIVQRGDFNSSGIANLLTNPPMIEASGKVSSTLKSPILYLKPTEKILPKIKQLWPETVLMGFKLLNGVTDDELMSVARVAMEKVDGDFVVANDLTQIKNENHKAFILARNGSVQPARTKTEIVDIIEDIANK